MTKDFAISLAKTGALALALAAALAACGGGGDDSGGTKDSFVATWTAAQSDINEDTSFIYTAPPAPGFFSNQTVRQVFQTCVGGSAMRLRFSNEYGYGPLTFDKVTIAKSNGGSSVDTTSFTNVTFSGNSTAVVPNGEAVWSDPIEIASGNQSRFAVSIYLSGTSRISTAHRFAQQSAYIGTGDLTSAATVPDDPSTNRATWFWLSEVDVEPASTTGVIAAIGDSITEGDATTVNANMRYPDQLCGMVLASNTAQSQLSVVNQGLGGNRFLRDVFGPNLASRFQRDILDLPGIRAAIILPPVNDLGFAFYLPDQTPTADQLIAAYTNTIKAAKEKNVKIFMATIQPYNGSKYFTQTGEQTRQAVNAWIRANKDVAAVFDYDAALRDSADPTRLAAQYDSGDHLHPNNAGSLKQAQTVDVASLRAP